MHVAFGWWFRVRRTLLEASVTSYPFAWTLVWIFGCQLGDWADGCVLSFAAVCLLCLFCCSCRALLPVGKRLAGHTLLTGIRPSFTASAKLQFSRYEFDVCWNLLDSTYYVAFFTAVATKENKRKRHEPFSVNALVHGARFRPVLRHSSETEFSAGVLPQRVLAKRA